MIKWLGKIILKTEFNSNETYCNEYVAKCWPIADKLRLWQLH